MRNSLHLPISKLVLCLLAVFLLCGCAEESTGQVNPSEPKYTTGIWFSYLDYQETARGKTESEFADVIDQVISNLQSIGVNTVYVHAEAFTDAFYNSEILPKTTLLGELTYDPLQIFTDKAHAADMRVEAWINPLRSVSTDHPEAVEGTILYDWIKRNDERIRPVEGRYYLNPAYPEVREFVCSVVNEILDKYPVDGIHMDDYFYPAETDQRFDAYIYGETIQTEDISIGDFRRRAVNMMVKEISDTVRKHKNKVRFGISVAGNLENDLNLYFADPQAWIDEKLIDYLIPQVYWGFEHPVKPYRETLKEWMAMTEGTETELYTGLAAYKIGLEDGYAGDGAQEWVENTDMLARQIRYALENNCSGAVCFRYASLFKPDKSVLGNVEKEIVNIKKLISDIEKLSD